MVNPASRSPDITGIGILSQGNTGLDPILLAADFEASGPSMAHLFFEQVEGTIRLNLLKNKKLQSGKIDHEYVWNKLTPLMVGW